MGVYSTLKFQRRPSCNRPIWCKSGSDSGPSGVPDPMVFFFSRSSHAAFAGQISLHVSCPRSPITGWRTSSLERSRKRFGGTQTHSRRTGSKLGRLHFVRQGLVRVPESNTKYGGKRGKAFLSHCNHCGNPKSHQPNLDDWEFRVGFARASDLPRGFQSLVSAQPTIRTRTN